jgi:flavin-binding protein dodecin
MSEHTYKHIELTGSSTKSSDDAVANAIAQAAKSIRNMHWFQIIETRGHIAEGKVAHWQVTLKVGFTLEG